MTVPLPDSSLDAPERRLETLVRLVPFALLVMSMIPYLVTQNPSTGDVGRTLAVVALAAAWVAWWVPLHPGWATNRALMSVYYLGSGPQRGAGGPQPVVRVLLLDRVHARVPVPGRGPPTRAHTRCPGVTPRFQCVRPQAVPAAEAAGAGAAVCRRH